MISPSPRATPGTHEHWVASYSDLSLEGLIRCLRRMRKADETLTEWQRKRLRAAEREQELRAAAESLGSDQTV